MALWQGEPFRIDVKAGETKAFCKCGKTKNPPFCDGSHAGSGITPYIETFDSDKTVGICGCGRSSKRPFCDGTHRTPE